MDKLEPMPRHIQDFIFVREMSEVYLLLDHISGRWDKSLKNPDLVRQICEIGWPPEGGKSELANQAALLMSAKDMLNSAARPASGLTIAFTLLVCGEDNVDHGPRSSRLRSLWSRVFGIVSARGRPVEGGPPTPPRNHEEPSPTDAPGLDDNTPIKAPPSRLSLARLAYPGLITSALWCKWAINLIIIVLLLWLILTCALSWDVAAGHAIYARVDSLRNQEALYEQKIQTLPPAPKGQTAGSTQDSASGDIGVVLVKECGPQQSVTGQLKSSDIPAQLTTVDEVSLCKELIGVRLDYAISRQNLAGWLVDWRAGLGSLADHLCSKCQPSRGTNYIAEQQTNEQWGAILLEVLASSVLPLCYGFLGAGAAVVRDLWGKMKESLLSPRDLTLALGQLALGAVIGGCIGLFVAPPGGSSSTGGGLLGTVVLSASALSFVAGFGVEGVFVALESLVKRVFNLPSPPKGPA